MSGALVGSPWPPPIGYGARNHSMHSMYLAGVPSAVHVAATDPFCAGRHPDLVTHAVVTDHGAGCVTTVAIVIARERRIIAARIVYAVMDSVVPVVIVIGVLTVPATVVRFKRVMRPANTRVGAADNNILPGISQRPDLRRVGVIDAGFNRLRTLEVRRRLNSRTRLRKVIVD